MKKTLVAIAALAAVSAFAQSTVGIDGIVNYGVANSVAKQATVGGWKGDRNVVNIRVTEDQGGGNKLSFQAQMRFDPANGGNKSNYGNSATGVVGDQMFEQTKITADTGSFGQVALGRFTNAQGVADLHPFEDAAQTTSPHQAINGRLSGQFQYTTPAVMGAKVWFLNAKASSNKYLGAGDGAGYLLATDLSAANLSTSKNPDAMHRDLSAVGVDYTNGPIYVHVNSMTDLTNTKSTKIGATYTNPMFKLYVNQYNQKDNLAFSATAATGTGLAAHKATEFAAKVPYGQYNFIYGHLATDTDVKLAETTAGASKVSKNAFGVTYDVTKRTQLQAYSSNTKNGDNTWFKNGHNSFFGLQHSF
jgi:hypothetical protein